MVFTKEFPEGVLGMNRKGNLNDTASQRARRIPPGGIKLVYATSTYAQHGFVQTLRPVAPRR